MEKYITPEMIKNWYKQQENIKDTVQEMIYTRNINTGYFSQSSDVSDLEEIIAFTYKIDTIEYHDDIVAIINHKDLKTKCNS